MTNDHHDTDTARQKRNAARIRRVLSRFDLFVWRDGQWERRAPLQWWLTRQLAKAVTPDCPAKPTRMMRRLKAAA
jgi:hypothetical protein